MPEQQQDPWLPRKQRNREKLLTAEEKIAKAVRAAMRAYLDKVRAAVLGEHTRADASPSDLPPNMDAWPPGATWNDQLDTWIVPATGQVWQDGYWSEMPSGDRDNPELDDRDYVDAHMRDTKERLTNAKWSDEVYDAVRDAMLLSRDQHESQKQLRERIADVLNIDKWSKRADVIARTESIAALNGGHYEAGRKRQQVFGEQLWKQWTSVHDSRTRKDHQRADGQIVGADDHFTVGGDRMRYPHDRAGGPEQTIQCRCVLNWLDASEVPADVLEQYPPKEPVMEEDVTAAASGTTSLPLAPESADWNPDAAKKRVAAYTQDDPKAPGKAFLWHDGSEDTSVTAYRLGIADVRDGQLVAVPQGVQRVAEQIHRGTVKVPEEDVSAVKRKVTAYLRKMNRRAPWESPVATESTVAAPTPKKKRRKDDEDEDDDEKQDQKPDTDDQDDEPEDDEDEDEKKRKRRDQRKKRSTTADAAPRTWAERVAAAVPAEPPATWFQNPELTGPTKIRVTDEGRVYGHVAAWGVEHAAWPGITADLFRGEPYVRFHRHPIRTADGVRVKTGPLATGGHADDVDVTAAQQHYDDPNFVAADVVAGEDQHGIWVSGALRHGVSPFQVQILDRYSISGDWKNGELLAACAVSAPGFHLDHDEAVVALAASAGARKPRLGENRPRAHFDDDGYLVSLTAAGVVTEREPVTQPPFDGWRLYREFKQAEAADNRVRSARRRLSLPRVLAAAARVRKEES